MVHKLAAALFSTVKFCRMKLVDSQRGFDPSVYLGTSLGLSGQRMVPLSDEYREPLSRQVDIFLVRRAHLRRTYVSSPAVVSTAALSEIKRSPDGEGYS